MPKQNLTQTYTVLHLAFQVPYWLIKLLNNENMSQRAISASFLVVAQKVCCFYATAVSVGKGVDILNPPFNIGASAP